MKKFGVNTPLKQAAFLATMSEESIGLSTMTENPSKYDSSKLRTKGRGIIQLTGDANYKAASERFDWGKFTIEKGKDGKERKIFTSWDLFDKPELAAKPDYAFPIAGWFWSEIKAGKNFPTADKCIGTAPDATLKDFKDASYAVNGWSNKKNGKDPIGWKGRVENYERALKAFNLGDETLFQNIKKLQKSNMKRFVLPIIVFCIFVQTSCSAPALLQQENTTVAVQPSPVIQSQPQTNQLANNQPEANPQNDNTYIYQTPGGVKKQIVFRRGQTSATVKGRVVRMDTDIYVISAHEGQKMSISITSIENNAAFDVRSTDDTSLCGSSFVKSWSGKLSATGNYTIEVGAERGNTTYKLSVSIK